MTEQQTPPLSAVVQKEMPSVKWMRELKPNTEISIFSHNNPDIDSMSSCLGMMEIFERLGHSATIYYLGQIAHPQNRVFMLQFDWSGLTFHLNSVSNDPEKKRELRDSIDKTMIVFVDTSNHPGKGNMKGIDEFVGRPPDLVIDHHEKIEQEETTVYERCRVGACATIVQEMAVRLEVDLPRMTSTSLMLGIELDTSYFQQDRTTERDVTAYESLRTEHDAKSYAEVMNYPKSDVFREMKKKAYCTMIESESSLVAGVGVIDAVQKDLMASIADELINYDNIQHALVIALINDDKVWKLAISYRTSSGTVNADELVKTVFGATFGAKKGAGAGELVIPDPLLSILQSHDDDVVKDAFDMIFRCYADKFVNVRRKLSS